MSDTLLPQIDLKRCTSCGQCLLSCTSGALVWFAGQPQLAQPQKCTYCGDCSERCVAGAITVQWEFVFSPL